MNINANGISLHVDDRGVGELALVFLHYWGGTARTWESVVAALPGTFRTVSLDARGWGGSDRPTTGYDIATLADDTQAAIKALGLRRYLLVGHSMGGKVAQLLASRRPMGLVGMLLVAPSPAQGKSLSPTEREGMLGAYRDEDSVAWTIDHVLAGGALSARLREQVIADSTGGAAQAKQAWPAAMIGEDVSAALADIDVPVRVIGGELDQVDRVDLLQRVVVPSLPGATLQVIPGVGHLLPLEAPAALAAQIVDFVEHEVTGDVAGARAPEALPSRFDEAFNCGDLDAVMALLHPQAVMRMTDGTMVDGGAQPLREALGGLMATRPMLRNTLRRALVSDDIALLLMDWTIRIDPPGQPPVIEQGTATQVAQRGSDGVWRLRISNPLGIR